jgi:hypothetical protein
VNLAEEQSLAAVRELASGLFAQAHRWDDKNAENVVEMPAPRWKPCRQRKRRKRSTVKSIKPQPREGEIRLAEFIRSEMVRCNVSKQVVYERLMAGHYIGVTVRKAAPRVTFVSAPSAVPNLSLVNKPQPGEVALKDWVSQEAARRNAVEETVYSRLRRGLYPWLELRKVNQRVVFVKVKAEMNNESRTNEN